MRATPVDARAADAEGTRDQGRILFLDYLRAIACLLVVFAHIYILGLNYYEPLQPWVPGLDRLLFGPDAAARNLFAWPLITVALRTDVNAGPLGVSVFFLISGFVILRAVERESTLTFIVRRIFRIYPVSLVSAFVAAGVTAIFCAGTGTVSPNSLASVVSSGLVLNGALHQFDAVPVMWSLEVELIFYGLMAILAARGEVGVRTLLVAGALCAAFTFAARSPAAGKLPPSLGAAATHLSFTAAHISYLLVGSMIWRATRTERFWRGACSVAAAVAVYCAARWAFATEQSGTGGVDVVNGFAALALFGLALWSGMRWRWIRPLRWIADISYPLYLLHVPLGWICLAWLASAGWGMLGAGVATGLIVLAVAWLVHVSVETHAQRFGVHLARALSRGSSREVRAV